MIIDTLNTLRTLLFQPRIGNFAAFIACTGMMGFALFAQHVLHLEPCPLCIFQRVALITLGGVFLLAAIHPAGRIGRRIYAVMLAAPALAGVGVAGRHVWLQNLPKDQVPACGPGLDFMVDTFPMLEVLDMVLSGSGECAEVVWRFLGLSMPTWTLVCFLALGGWGVWLNWTNRQPT
ncbi:MAG: disulfide bond formation protein B [Gammaproteobacteria bacterium]|jgi:disulfide bond formation protein DsbB|nr:disulfide bond formation protein B [Chromatiales bacterium]MDP6675279.1 disulfide bond formation protein B [Gammaproteobacteria bacterium]